MGKHTFFSVIEIKRSKILQICLNSKLFFLVFLKQKMIQQLLYDLPSVSLIFWTKSAIKLTFFRDAIWHKWPRFLRVSKEKLISSPKSDRQFFLKLFFRVPFYRNHFKRKNMWGYGINFWNGSFKQNLTKERKQPSRGPF